MATIIMSDEVNAELATDEMISDDAARTIASWWHGGSDHNITALSHGIEWHPSRIIDEIDQLVTSTRERLGYSDEANESIRSLNALREWTNSQMVVGVWSSYGHTFMSDGDYETCLTCGATYELVITPDGFNDGRYRTSNGDDPMECTGDTSMVHGEGYCDSCEESCEHCQHECNCIACRG